MLRASYAPMLSEQDQLIFDTLVPADILSATARRWPAAITRLTVGPPMIQSYS